ncbi:dihydrofolate reductase family protein [Actinobacillus capsulatus]|uniref:dihydrofolate reductase family protein n=1 Tax=Actinobacillus capsulatus TaxID=717 RepID=UPI0003823C43|nr:dihydrofolate reductase family protein [Actinobacillus capsulatus]
MKPYHLYCHMTTSIDGKVSGNYLNNPQCEPYIADYYELFDIYFKQMKNGITGRVSVDENFTHYHKVNTDEFKGKTITRDDYIVPFDKETTFFIVLDTDGKLGWTKDNIAQMKIQYPTLKNSHIVSILSETVADDYLLYLQNIGVSYLFAGNRPLDLVLMLDKLHQKLGLNEILLTGGGTINGSFMQAGLIDTIILVQTPLVESNANSISLFQSDQNNVLPRYELSKYDVLKSGALHLIYQKV